MTNSEHGSLTELDRLIYEWQFDVSDFGESGQLKLRQSTALVSRVGGLGGPLAIELAAAGFGKIILAHGGLLKHSDLNRQILMRHECLGTPRAECAAATLKAFKTDIEVESVNSNITEENVCELVSKADIIFDCAPLFEERFLLNREAVRQNKPMIDSAMYNMYGQIMTVIPGETPCLSCVFPEVPPNWHRRFPVLGALSAMIANIGALEGIKLLSSMKGVHKGQMVLVDGTCMSVDKINLQRIPDCPVCSHLF